MYEILIVGTRQTYSGTCSGANNTILHLVYYSFNMGYISRLYPPDISYKLKEK